MLKRLELSAPGSCLNKAGPEEPIFVLRAKDRIAAMAVRHWATMAFGAHEKTKIDEAMKWADDADKWRQENVPQTPLPSPMARPDASQLAEVVSAPPKAPAWVNR